MTTEETARLYALLKDSDADPQSETRRQKLLAEISQWFVAQSPPHFFHRHPALLTELLAIFSFAKTDTLLETMKEGLATELLACCHRCLDSYASSKVTFKAKYSALYNPKLLSLLETKWNEWDASRLLAACSRLDPMESIYSPSDSLGSRILKQVLWHPNVLQVRDFDHILVKFLAVVRFPSEFLAEAPEKLLSGLSLLSIHIEPTVREWTWTALVQFKKMKLGLESATKHVFPTIKLLLSISAVESSRYNLATERQCRFRLLAELLSMLDPVALKVAAGRYLDVGAFRDSLVDTILASSSNEFWALLRIGMHLLSAELLDTAKWTQSFGKIIRHKTFHASCISDARTDGDTPQKFSWIRSLLKDPKNHWILREIKVELALYSPRNKDAIGHLLLDIATHASKMPVPDAVFFDQLALYLIQIFSSEIPPPSQAIRFISERFSANVQTLYTGFVSNQDPPVDLTPLWKSVTLNRVSHHFKFIALHAFGEVASVGLAETSPATRTSFTEIEKIVLSLLKSLKSASTSVKQSLLNHLQDVIVSILMASNQSIYNALYELIRESSNFSTTEDLFLGLAKADPKGFSESAKDSLSKLVFVSSRMHRMQPNVTLVEKLLHLMPLILNALQAHLSQTDCVMDVKVLVVGAMSRFLKLLEGWAKTSVIPSIQVRNLVVSTLRHAYNLFPFIQATSIQTTYLVGLAIKWLLVDDQEIRETSFLVCRQFLSGLSFASSDLQKLGDITQKVIQTKKLPPKQELDFVEIFRRSGIKIIATPTSDKIPSKVIIIDDPKPAIQQDNRSPEYVRDAAYIYDKSKNYDKSKKPVSVDRVWSDLAQKSLKRKLPMSLKTEPKFKIARPSQPTTSSSILQQIKSEVALQYTKASDPLKSNTKSRVPDVPVTDVPTRVTEKDDPPSKPKRSTQLIEITGPKPRGVSIRVPGSNPSARLKDLTSLYKEILAWDYDPDRSNKAPSSVPPLRKIPDNFEAQEDYMAVFEPLLLMECWSQLVRAKDENLNPLKWTATCQEVSMVDSFNDLAFSCATSDFSDRDFPSENDMVLAAPEPKSASKNYVRGVLARVKSVSTKGGELKVVLAMHLVNRSDIRSCLRPSLSWSFKKICSLTTIVREYEALSKMKDFFLYREICKPIRIVTPAIDRSKLEETMKCFKVNQPQAAAILASTSRSKGFVLIQGPPGTGKTRTLLAIIGANIQKATPVLTPGAATASSVIMRKNKLLCCAPSNAAVDEIGRRLLSGIIDRRGRVFKPKVVRIGTSAMHSDVNEISLDYLIEKEFNASSVSVKIPQEAAELDSKRSDINQLISELHAKREELRLQEQDSSVNPHLAKEISEVTTKLTDFHRQLDNIKTSRDRGSQALERARREVRSKLLREADIVLATLSGSGHDTLRDVKDMEFPTVIVDEACQSIEISALIPLQFGASKCILVGDPNQLPPTVISQEAQDYLYEQSLFQRIMKGNSEVVQLLTIQYRMHPEICQFPSEFFYASALVNGPRMAELAVAPWHSNPFFRPYQFFDVIQGREQKTHGNSLMNVEEARVCACLIQLLVKKYPRANFAHRIGVITFYKRQVGKIKEQLDRIIEPELLKSIDVMTVDGFQGQEKDIIILSCVRTGRGLGFITDVRRMNVALTRAKKTLIILGSAHALQGCQEWQALLSNARDRSSFSSISEGELRRQIGDQNR